MERHRVFAGSVVTLAIGAAALTILLDWGDEAQTARAYRGLTGQHLPVQLRVTGERLGLDVSWAGNCPGNLYVGGVERTRRRAVGRIGGNGRFTWAGRHRVTLDTYDEFVPVRLTGRVLADGAIAGRWRTGTATGGAPDPTGCTTADTRFVVRPGGSLRAPAPRAIGNGLRATPLGDTAEKVAAGAGRIWVLGTALRHPTGRTGSVVTQIDPATGRVVARTPVRGGALGAGAGAVWLVGRSLAAGSRGTARTRYLVTRIDPLTHRVRFLPPGLGSFDVQPDSTGFVVTARGLWILVGSRVLRLDPRTGRVVKTIRLPRGRGMSCRRRDHGVLLAAGGGAVWVGTQDSTFCASTRTTRRLLRIDPRTSRVTRVVRLRAAYGQLAVGSGGVWALTDRDQPSLHRIDRGTGRPLRVVSLRPASVAGDLVVRRDAVWFTASVQARVGGCGLLRATPGGRRAVIVRRVHTLDGCSNVAVDRHGAWIVDRGARELIRATSPGRG